ncbi:hypothetical protein ACWCPQ_07955 [Nocardia sp. NPDC001965]
MRGPHTLVAVLAHNAATRAQQPAFIDPRKTPAAANPARYVPGHPPRGRHSDERSAAPAALAVTGRDHIVFGSDWPFSAATLPQSGNNDPAPRLSEIFDTDRRMEIECRNPLRQLPRLAEAVGG